LGTGMGEWPAPTASGAGPEGAEFKARLMVEKDMWQMMAGTRVGETPARRFVCNAETAAGNLWSTNWSK
jgi:hypothetical protein